MILPYPSKRTIVLLLIIICAGVAVYSNTFKAPFVFDDGMYIENDPIIRSFHYFAAPGEARELPAGPDFTPGVKQAFKTRPVGFLTFALNYRFGGLNAAGFHLFNLLIHLLNAILVYFLLAITFRTRPDEKGKTSGQAIAFFTALLFTVHPVQTQAVTYITQRFASLAAFFYLSSILLYKSSCDALKKDKKALFYASSLFSAVLAMLTKEISFTLPLMIALYDLFFLEGPTGKRAKRLAPFFASMAIIPIRLASGGLQESMETLALSAGVSWRDYLFTELRVIVMYIRLLLFPAGQNIDYDFPVSHSLFEGRVFFSFLFLFGMALLAIYLFYRSKKDENKFHFRVISFGIFWFFITLSVESGLVPIGDFVFEHRLYLPSAGFLLALATAGFPLLDRMKKYRLLAFGMPLSILLVFGAAAYERNGIWRDPIKLWEDTAHKSPAKFRPHNNLSVYYGKAGRYSEAIRESETALALAPDNSGIYLNLGGYYEKMGIYDKAAQEFTMAGKLQPGDYRAYEELGNIDEKEGRLENAVKEYQEALALAPANTEIHNDLGIAYAVLRDYRDAEKEFTTALNIDPGYNPARNNLEKLRRIERGACQKIKKGPHSGP